jgi:hypothetical protein
LPLVTVFSQIHEIHTLPPYYFPTRPSQCCLPFTFCDLRFEGVSHTSHTCSIPAHLRPLDFINLIKGIQGVFKKDRTFAIKTLFYNILSSPLRSSPLYRRYPVPNVSSIVGILPGTHFLCWSAVLLSHFPEPPRVQKKTELFK